MLTTQAALLLISVLALFTPTFIELFSGLWTSEQNAHGPIVLGVSLWYSQLRVRQLITEGKLNDTPNPGAGWGILIFGLVTFIVGRTQSIYLFEVGAIIPILAGILTHFSGFKAVKRMGFAFFFMFFMVPLPGSLIDALTQPMKIAVSWGAEHVLHWMELPVARSGVIIYLAHYQLLVADACAGLNSLFTLEALGLLYMNLIRHESALRNITLAILIVPISFTANVIRVCTLALITHRFGDEAGQGFVHGLSGMVLFMSALALIISMDGFLRKIAKLRKGKTQPI